MSNFGNFWFCPSKSALDAMGSDDGLNVGAIAFVMGDQLYTVESTTATTSTSVRASRSDVPKYFHDTLSNANAKYPSWTTGGFVTAYASDAEGVAPFDGKLLKVMLRTANAAGNTTIGFRRAGAEVSSLLLSISADTPTEFDFDGLDNTFSAGDLIGLGVDPTSAPGETRMTAVWEYTP